MADLPAYTGLYVSLMSMVMYLILGTSHHLSMGKNLGNVVFLIKN